MVGNGELTSAQRDLTLSQARTALVDRRLGVEILFLQLLETRYVGGGEIEQFAFLGELVEVGSVAQFFAPDRCVEFLYLAARLIHPGGEIAVIQFHQGLAHAYRLPLARQDPDHSAQAGRGGAGLRRAFHLAGERQAGAEAGEFRCQRVNLPDAFLRLHRGLFRARRL